MVSQHIKTLKFSDYLLILKTFLYLYSLQIFLFSTFLQSSSHVTQEEYFDLSSAGAIFSFSNSGDEDWSKLAFGVNYRILADFSNSFVSSGNSGIATFDFFPFDVNTTPILYNIGNNQQFFNTYNGDVSELNLTFGGTYRDKIHLGAGLNFYDITFSQFATLREENSDGNGNTLNASFFQDNYTAGTGFSLSAGLIYKASKNLRLGISYQTPTWYSEIIEDTNIVDNDGYFGVTEITVSEDPQNIYQNYSGRFTPRQSFDYALRTPSKLTTSAALIFGKIGLISMDYISENFKGLNLNSGNADFSNENLFFDNNLIFFDKRHGFLFIVKIFNMFAPRQAGYDKFICFVYFFNI